MEYHLQRKFTMPCINRSVPLKKRSVSSKKRTELYYARSVAQSILYHRISVKFGYKRITVQNVKDTCSYM